MNLKKNGKVFTSKSVGTGPSSYEKRIYRAAVSQILRNTGLEYEVDDRGIVVQILAEARDFSLFHSVSSPALGPIKPPVHLVQGTLYPVSKQPRGEDNHTSPSSAEVKNGGVLPPLLNMPLRRGQGHLSAWFKSKVSDLQAYSGGHRMESEQEHRLSVRFLVISN